ncbi:uncharacterized protein LOC143050876 [Mytilus galloprovincialis]|uniref:uncharacterized protein LOC143050876 n=1 Tax=Mytilus galloprovincialis TaxID=29158 RepID=UPI003F7CAED7
MTNVQSGSYVRLVNFNRTLTYDKKTKGQKPVLANMTGSSIEILPTPEEDDISSNEEDSEDENANYSINGNLIGLDSSNNYRCCLNEKCYYKKVNDKFTCPKCGNIFTPTTAGHAVVLKTLIQCDQKMQKLTIFTPQLKVLLESATIPVNRTNLNEAISSLKKKLPLKVFFQNEGDIIKNIKSI